MICKSEDGTLIYGESNLASRSVGSILLVHGLGEHSGRYREFAEQLNGWGYDVHRIDLRGHGRSNGVRGHVNEFSDYYRDLDAWLVRLESGGELKKDIPCFLFGHSLGGLISYLYLSQRKAPPLSVKISGLILSAPAFGLLPGLKTLVESSLAKRVPEFFRSLQMPSGIRSEQLSHDDEVVRLHKADPLVHSWATPGFYVELTAAIKSLPKTVDRLAVPLLVMLAGKDKVVNTATAEKFTARLSEANPGLVTKKVFHGFFHEIFNETKRERVYRELKQWMQTTVQKKRITKSKKGSSKSSEKEATERATLH